MQEQLSGMNSDGLTSVSIHDSTNSYSIDAFALAMALREIAETVDGAAKETDE